jgi:hypothetical protein
MTSEIVDDFLRGDISTEEISNRSFSELRRYVGIMWEIHQEDFVLLSSAKGKKLYLDNKIQECGSRISILESGEDLALYSGEPAPSKQKIAIYRNFLSAMKNSNFRIDRAYSGLDAEIKNLQGIKPVPSNLITENKNNILKKGIEKKTSPITVFIDEQINAGKKPWQEAWTLLYNQAQGKIVSDEDLREYKIGEFRVFLRKAIKHSSKGRDRAVEYQEGDSPEWKKVLRQSFGTMFRRALKKSRTLSDSPK